MGSTGYTQLCLARNEDNRCPLCRVVDSTKRNEENRLPLQLTTTVSQHNELCSVCFQIIPHNVGHSQLTKCKHHMHNDCVLHGMMVNGVSVLGVPFCRTCMH